MKLLELGARVEPVIDGYFIETLENARLELNRPRRREEVLTFSKPWEGRGSLGTAAFRHAGKVYLYYRGFPDFAKDEDEKQVSCLALSEDGVRFERAEINLIGYDGIRDNNIVFMGTQAHNFMPFYDPNPGCPADERFKAVGGLLSLGGLFAYKSADGIRWHLMSEKPVITQGTFDSLNTAFFDPAAGLYRCYSRYFTGKDYGGVRAIQSCVSEDFIRWSEPVPNRYPEGITDHLYTNATQPVPGAEHILVSFPMRFVQSRKKLEEYEGKGVSDAVFMSSRDGVHWERAFKTAWIAGGLNPRDWTQRCFIPVTGIVETGDEFSFYVEERYMWDDCCIVRYTIPKHRFGSVCADADGGRMVTKPFVFKGGGLFLNYATSAAGFIKIAALGEDGKAIEGFGFDDCAEMFGNELAPEVRWNGRALGELKGKKISLAFELNDARLFALGKGC